MTVPNVKTIDDLETIKVLADERRLALLRMLAKSQTVKELSTALDLPQSQLYYHVNLLEKHGLIQVVDTKVISGIIEKHYRTTAHQFRIRNPMLMGSSITNAETTAIFSSVLDETKEEMQEAFRKAPPRTTDEPPLHPFISHQISSVNARPARTISCEVGCVDQKCDIRWENVDTEAEEYSLLVAFFQADSGDKEIDHGS
ncbi:MAG: helix-turn-helix domain-containing protein [Caldilineaceae bacterium]